MKFFDEMLDKWGFQDGGSVPAEARAARCIYVQVINKLAEKYGSSFRAAAFNHMNHNGCMILFFGAEDLAKISPDLILTGPDWSDVGNLEDFEFHQVDEAMQRAVQNADDTHEFGLDSLVYSGVVVDQESLGELLEKLEGLPPEGELHA